MREDGEEADLDADDDVPIPFRPRVPKAYRCKGGFRPRAPETFRRQGRLESNPQYHLQDLDRMSVACRCSHVAQLIAFS